MFHPIISTFYTYQKLILIQVLLVMTSFNQLLLLNSYLFVVTFGNGIRCTFLITQKLSSSVICEKFNLKTYYPPFMNGKFGVIKKQTLEIIRKAIDQFSWVMCFTDIDADV